MSYVPLFPSTGNRGYRKTREPDPELDEWKSRLLGAFKEIQSVGGDIVAYNHYASFTNPGLSIKENAIIPLPLNEQAAQDIKSHCHRALADNAWKLDHTQFQLTNPAWPQFLQTVVGDAEKPFDSGRLSPKLKHLTLYGPGPIPKESPHKGIPRSLHGTLTIILPSEHQGADVNLSVYTKSHRFAPAPTSVFGVTAMSWLRGVKCETEDLISGYRLALTYDLEKVDRYYPGPHYAEILESAMSCVESILEDWSSSDFPPGIEKVLFPLADESNQFPRSLVETKGRDRAVCQFLNDICPKVGCYYLFAQVTHEITENYGRVTEAVHTIDWVTTPLGLDLPIDGDFDAEKEILGFSQDKLQHRDTNGDDDDDDDDDDSLSSWESEGRSRTHPYRYMAVIIVPWEGVMSLIEGHVQIYASGSRTSGHDPGSCEFYGHLVENLVGMVTTEMERSPNDKKAREIMLDVMARLSRTGAVLAASAVERIIELSLASGDKELYDNIIAVTSFSTSSDATNTVKLLEKHLTKEYLDKGDVVYWDDWLGLLQGRPFKDFRRNYTNIKLNFENETLSKSFDAWAMAELDWRIEAEQEWDSLDCNMALDWIKERSEKQDWILNRFLPSITEKAGRKFLFDLLHALQKENGKPGFLNATAMRRSIMQRGFGKLIIQIQDFGKRSDPIITHFLSCIQDCHLGGLPEEARGLMAAASVGLAKSRHSSPPEMDWSRAIMKSFANPLAEMFGRGVAEPVPEFGELVEVLIRDFISTNLTPIPVKPDGWTYDARGCSSCHECQQLDTFLASPTNQSWDCIAPKKRRKHIKEILSSDTTLRLQTTPRGVLIVTKTGGEYQPKVEKWQAAYRELKNLVNSFRNGAMRGCLGDEKYRELVLLEGYAKHSAELGVAGTRRRATSPGYEPESQRRRVM
ncbi:hypothetical protein CEP51_003308 [Fusarium floridanum]|uniref:Uncharacterized protein n=1 Tax=Fusarium floridanum TaxID=1325733 RepID=A0A428S6N2_9HYPO|nr:hypothetical protein CEP51_003308 [Fusarium floridanum]